MWVELLLLFARDLRWGNVEVPSANEPSEFIALIKATFSD